jgi:hypothetical protein
MIGRGARATIPRRAVIPRGARSIPVGLSQQDIAEPNRVVLAAPCQLNDAHRYRAAGALVLAQSETEADLVEGHRHSVGHFRLERRLASQEWNDRSQRTASLWHPQIDWSKPQDQ